MKEIKLIKLTLHYFKGAKDVEVAFNGQTCSIRGANGTGKSTLFDAFTWLLFGKNANDKKDFGIKTYDLNGVAIPRVNHEVHAVITVNGEEIKLCRQLVEKWTKRRGSAVEEFTGNEEKFWYNDVPCSLKEWNGKIADIIPEQTFKAVTNPRYFTSLKADVQRQMLMTLAGEITEMEIVGGDASFAELLSKISGKTLEDYKKQIAAKKKIVRDGINSIPARIDECRRGLKDVQKDKDELDEEIKRANEKAADIFASITRANAAANEHNEKIISKTKEIGKIDAAILQLKNEIGKRLNEDYYKHERTVSDTQTDIENIRRNIQLLEQNLKTLVEQRADAEQKIAYLREQFIKVREQNVVIDGNKEFICPTCKRPLEVAEIERRQAEIIRNFNENKVEKLNDINKQGKALNEKVQIIVLQIKAAEKKLEEHRNALKEKEAVLNDLKQRNIYRPTDSDIDAELLCSKEYRLQLDKKEQVQQEIENMQQRPVDCSGDDLKLQYKELTGELEQLKEERSKIDINKNIEKRCMELETELRTASAELATLEGEEFTVARFQKRKIELVEQRISSYFKTVRWKMYDTQINGGEVECCIPLINGTPYADANNASQINAGIDIINAFASQTNVIAPIWVDNAEGVNHFIETPAQMIKLYVTKDASFQLLNE